MMVKSQEQMSGSPCEGEDSAAPIKQAHHLKLLGRDQPRDFDGCRFDKTSHLSCAQPKNIIESQGNVVTTKKCAGNPTSRGAERSAGNQGL